MKPVFVFGSNLAGRHGKGAALAAWKMHGAIRGQGIGRQGNSYAIPTKDENLKPLPLTVIKKYVDEFLAYAKANPTTKFKVTALGCGLAGFKASEIAPMFKGASNNCILPSLFLIEYMAEKHEAVLRNLRPR